MTNGKGLPARKPETTTRRTQAKLPGWVPEAARIYLAHVEGGRSIRDLAREARVSPSTVLRQVRRIEIARDDPLVDEALRSLAESPLPLPATDRALEQRALPALRRLAESDTVLAVARDMENGVILRERPGSEPLRLYVLERGLAESMALRGWIDCPSLEARIRRYRITGPGREALRRALAQEAAYRGLEEAPAAFRGPEAPDPHLSHLRSMLAESPLAALSRRRDGEGQPFLCRDLVAAGERLREDFDVAETVPDLDWEALLDDLAEGRPVPAAPSDPYGPGAARARARVMAALADLGPGLADVALRCCCLTEGLEVVEKRMGWSQRSGKIVLRIALQRLRQHYAAHRPALGPLVG
jgi:hypothetical protein